MAQGCFPISHVREISSLHDYREIEHNETSRLIGFRKDSTRINVYYSTGTIGTCLNHPRKGKTQLFRRNVSLSQLESIFEDPRRHTGKGYYRKTTSQNWKSDEGPSECDSTRRWRFVTAASGLSTNSAEIEAVATFFTTWDRIFWPTPSPPDIYEIQFGCGAVSGLMSMVMEVSKNLDGVVHCALYKDVMEYKERKITIDDIERQTKIGYECCNVTQFLEIYSTHRELLRNMLSKMKKEIRIELVQWLVGRNYCGFRLYDANYNEIRTKHSNIVNALHFEYAELMYPKKNNLCLIHGVIWN